MLLVAAALAPHATVHAAEPKKASDRAILFPGYAVIPLGRGQGNHLLMHATVGGKRIVFGVDTGAAVSLLDYRKARQMGLQPPPAGNGIPAQSVINGKLTDVFILPDLITGGVNLGGGPMVAQKNFASREAYYRGKFGSVDGLIGADILNRHKAILNCRTMQMFLNIDPKYAANPSATLRRAGYERVPISKDKHIFIPARLRGEDFVVAIDTGAPYTLFRRQVIDRFRMRQIRSHALIKGINAPERTMFVVLPENHDLSFGGVPIRMAFGALNDSVIFENAPSNFLGLLGADMLAEYSAVIDYRNSDLWLKPPTKPRTKK